MAKSSGLILEGIMVMAGKESPEKFIASVLAVVLGDLILTRRVTSMDFIYFPEQYFTFVVLILAVSAVAFPILVGVVKKNESNHKGDDWEAKYKATIILDMPVTAFGGLILMSLVAQRLAGMNDMTYLCFLPFSCLFVSWLFLTLLNKGIKGTFDQLARMKQETKEGMEQLKQ